MAKFYPKQAGTTEQSFKIGVGQGKFSQTIDASGLTTDQTWIVPGSAGSYGDVLTTDGSGALSWAAPGASSDSTTPFYIPPGGSYTVNADKQALYAEDILVEGTIILNGDLVDTRSPLYTLPNTAVTPGVYGDVSHIPQFTVDAQGRLTSSSNIAITTPSAVVTLTGNVTGTGNTGTSIDTVIPVIASNSTISTGNALLRGAADALVMGHGAIAGDYYGLPIYKTYITAVGNGAYGAWEGSSAFGGNANVSTTHGTAIGFNSIASGPYNSTAIGVYAIASGQASFAFGQYTQASGTASIGFGTAVTSSGDGGMAFGDYSVNSNPNGIVIGQQASSYSGRDTCVLGGHSTSTGSFSTILGPNLTSKSSGTIMSGAFADAAYTVQGTLNQTTTNATPLEVLAANLYGETFYLIVENNRTYVYTTQFVATNNTDYLAMRLDFVISCNGTGTVTIQGTPVKTIITQTSGASAWDVNVTASTRPDISVTGDASSTVYWSGSYTATVVKTA